MTHLMFCLKVDCNGNLVYNDDLLSLHMIKTHFWECDQPDMEVYLRRRTIEGEWIWLVANVVSYIDSPFQELLSIKKQVCAII